MHGILDLRKKNSSRSNKLVYDIFDLGNKRIVKVVIPVYGIFHLGNKQLDKVEYISVWYIRPW